MSLLNPWVLLGIAGALVVSFLAGVKVESDHRDAQLLVQERAFHQAYVETAARYRGVADGISAQLNKERAVRDADAVHFSNALNEAIHAKQLTKTVCPKVGEPAGEPTVLVNAGLWNAALKIGAAASGDTGRPDGGAAGADFVAIDEAYANLGENAGRWSTCRTQVRGWQTLAIKNGWVTQ